MSSTLSSLIASKNGNKIVMSCPETIGSMYADQMRVRQALMNLVSNASKFTSNGTVTDFRRPTTNERR